MSNKTQQAGDPRLLWIAGPVAYRRMETHWLAWHFVGETQDGYFHRWTLWFIRSEFSVQEVPNKEEDDQAHLHELRALFKPAAFKGRRVRDADIVSLLRSMVPRTDLAEATRMMMGRAS